MKYILKKPMPFIDSETIIKINVRGEVVNRYFLDSGEFVVTANELEALIAQGWVEKVKPREWWLAPSGGYFPYMVKETEEEGALLAGAIKVREVL